MAVLRDGGVVHLVQVAGVVWAVVIVMPLGTKRRIESTRRIIKVFQWLSRAYGTPEKCSKNVPALLRLCYVPPGFGAFQAGHNTQKAQ